jgi:hypothetical protein
MGQGRVFGGQLTKKENPPEPNHWLRGVSKLTVL